MLSIETAIIQQLIQSPGAGKVYDFCAAFDTYNYPDLDANMWNKIMGGGEVVVYEKVMALLYWRVICWDDDAKVMPEVRKGIEEVLGISGSGAREDLADCLVEERYGECQWTPVGARRGEDGGKGIVDDKTFLNDTTDIETTDISE